jgi:hypothetical protein
MPFTPSDVLGIRWQKASQSATNGECVEVAPAFGWVAIRDSKNPTGAMLESRPATWQTFLSGVKQGVFDLPRP